MTETLREQVRENYARAALQVLDGAEREGMSGGCCGAAAGADAAARPGASGCCGTPADAPAGAIEGAAASACCGADAQIWGPALYEAADLDAVPSAARLASLGCGNPTAVADLREGETVLDLGSGGGIDVLLSARRVGPTGKAYGLDMTEEMLALALRNRAEAGATNVEFLKGDIEAIPLPASTVDVVISNCVINLSVDKPAVFTEMARVLRPGGRIGISDVVAEDRLTPLERAERGSHVGCIAGALSFAEYTSGLTDAGFTDIELVPTHAVADAMHSVIVRAVKPIDHPLAAGS